MRVVMGGEALIGQKTGIGQYTEQLSQHLVNTSGIDDFKFLAHGKLFSSEFLLGQSAENNQELSKWSLIPDSLAKIRGIASQNRFAVWCYWHIMRRMDRHALRKYSRQDIYHSPNYMLPTFPGKRVVTILDLSTVKHPEFHPRARVDLLNKHIDNAIRHADHIITISDFIRQEVIKTFGVAEDRITTTHLAASDEFAPLAENEFDAKNKFPDISYKDYFLCAATIEPRKNISRLLDAYTLYRKRVGDDTALPLVITGHAGWHSGPLHRRIRELTKSGGVKYLGYISQQQMPAIFAGARALLFPSIYEGFGLPVLEAMQAGTAVLTSNDSAMSEVAGDAALLVDPENTNELCEKICELTSNEKLIKELAKQGSVRSRMFSWAHCADQTNLIYKKLV